MTDRQAPSSRGALYLLITGLVLLAIPFHLRPDNFIVDDGYFYPEIARFIASGEGSTFNGIMPTNGYHPLWMIVCVAAASLTHSPGPLVQELAIVQDLLIAGVLIALLLAAHKAKMSGACIGALPLLFIGMTVGIWRLLECHLALALQVASLYVAVPLYPGIWNRNGWWRDLILGVLLGLTVLSRLDLIFFVLVILSHELLTKTQLSATRRLTGFFLQTAATGTLTLPYLVWNLIRFHHLLPISAAIKSTFPHPHGWVIQSFAYAPLFGILVAAALLFKKSRNSFETALVLAATATACHIAYSLSFGELAPWYLTTGYLTASMATLWLADQILWRLPKRNVVDMAIAGTAIACLIALGWLRVVSNFTYTRFVHHAVTFEAAYVEPKRALAEKLRAVLPAGSRVYIFDAPGGVAFYSGMNLLPADGLVADYTFNARLADQGFTMYAHNMHISYFIAPLLHKDQVYDRLFLYGKGYGTEQSMLIQAPLTRKPAGTVILHNADIVFRFRQINPELETSMPELGVWRLPQ